MNQIQVVFNYNGSDITVQSNINTKFKEIYKIFKFKTKAESKNFAFMYNGILIQNDELTFNEIANEEDKQRKRMNVLVDEIEEKGEHQNNQNEHLIKSKTIICSKCHENIKLKFENYVISLFECRNKHKIDNIFLDKFDSTQIIDISKIICDNCKK